MDGRIDLVVVGGTGPYLFNWSNGSFNQNQQNLDTGVYTVVVTEVNGQTASATIKLYQPNVLEVTLKPVVYDGGYHIIAAGNNDGVIEAQVKGGTADYSYLWSNGETQYKADNLYAGNYSITVTDMNACTATASVVLTQPTPLQVVSIASPLHNGYNVSCKDGSDGVINLVVAGGVQSAPYTYNWSNGRITQNLTGMQAGNYSVLVQDAAGAMIAAQITITEPPLFKISSMVPSLYPNGKNLSCNTCSNGSITVNTTGGVGTPTYLWETGQTTQTITNQQAGTYFVTVTDLNGCSASSSKSLVAPERDDWSMFGNNGTNPNSQFMGTTDSVDFVFRTKNTERLRIKGNGSLIVNGFSGTSTRLLRVDANGNVEPGDPVESPGTISGLCDQTSRLTLAWYRTNILGPWSDYDLINCSQRFGFGVWTPQERIHVNGFSRYSSVGTSNYLNIGHDGNSKINSIGTDLFINSDSPQNVSVNTGATQGDFSTGGNAFLATLSGKVGIRNSNPHDDVEIGDLFTLHNDGVNCWMGYNSIFQGSNKRIVDGYASRITFGNQGDIFLGTAGNGFEVDPINSWNGLKIDNEGKVGIGNHSPHDDVEIGNLFTLHNDGDNSWIGYNSLFQGNNKRIVDGYASRITFGNQGDIFLGTLGNGLQTDPISSWNGLKIDNEGKVGIGTPSPSKTLTVNGDVQFLSTVNGNVNNSFQILFNDVPVRRGISIDPESNSGDFNFFIHEWQESSSFNFIRKNNDDQNPSLTKLLQIREDGKVGIGISDGSNWNGDYKLYVRDGIRTEKIKVDVSHSVGWADFVLSPDYDLISLLELEKYIKENKHLPGIPTYKEVKEHGIDVAEIQTKLLKNIEELTLYVIQLQKEINELKKTANKNKKIK